MQLWVQLAAEIAKDPCAARKLLVDPLNEPDEHGLRWEDNGGKQGILRWGVLVILCNLRE